MPQHRSDFVWEHWYKSSEKFDYFMSGLSSALTAFVAQGLERIRPGMNAAGLEAIAAVLLCVAVGASLYRLRYHVAALSANALELYHYERRGNLVSVLIRGGSGVLVDDSTGDTYSVAGAQQKIALHENALKQIEPQAKLFKRRTEMSYKIRDWLLFSGLAFYVASRIWRAFP